VRNKTPQQAAASSLVRNKTPQQAAASSLVRSKNPQQAAQTLQKPAASNLVGKN
jgi:hypothetical protein